MNYIAEPPTASCLYALEVPPSGGDTGFCNMYRALEEMPQDLLRRIEGLRIKHDSSHNSAGFLRQGAAPVTDVSTCPGAVPPFHHPHPATGRNAALHRPRRYAT